MENCPYCGSKQKLNEDYEQCDVDYLHEHECNECEKTFTFFTEISFNYRTFKADCLNGEPHIFKAPATYPRECTRMRCQTCEETRQPTEEEWRIILKK